MTHPIKGGRHKHRPSWAAHAFKQEGNPMPPPQPHPGLQDVAPPDQQSAMPGPGPSPDMDGEADLDQS